ncbi:MAG TPA: isoprenyl transferase [Symbiobacteriaceae bacterium]|nr:isoprenyl transferase [Symbiobacteriaceae bacterium]
MFEQLRRLVGKGTGAAVVPAAQVTPSARHVGVIMDGNGRWAQRRGLPRPLGHRAGVEALKGIVRAVPDFGVEMLTCYAFSTENWKREPSEVDALMALLVEFCRKETETLKKNGVRVQAIGRLDELPELQRREIARAVAETAGNSRLILTLAVNYGGQAELVDAVRAIARDVEAGRLAPEAIDAGAIGARLYTAGMPDPDLVIRTGGELRLSNFLIWQAAYSELWVSDVLWPDFRPEHLAQALHDFGHRERRYGGVLK